MTSTTGALRPGSPVPAAAGPAAPGPAPAGGSGAYGLQLPTVQDARSSVERVHGARAAEVWTRLLADAGLHGREHDRGSLERLLQAMTGSGEPVTALCARALRIRLTSYDRLSTASTIVHGSDR
ncbi:hypothetical protein [Kineococcus sp. SYSU DK005]|uniref:hypothetical protein n=1 Tax=Kineococcus sp. SYSU DK005 TaxID=3383126 RepID=UPI003D7E8AB0